MERNQGTIIAIIVAGLLAAVAIGFAVKGTQVPDVPEPEPVLENTTTKTVKGKRDGPKIKPKQPRNVPEAAFTVSADQYKTTESGLMYYDIEVGTGASPVDQGMVHVEYAGFLTDGKLFDSSYTRPDTFIFPLGKEAVIPGWDEGVATMKVGGKRQLKIPSDLAYGDQGRPPVIPPKATLIFDIELKDVQPPRVAPEAPQKFDDADYTVTETGLKFKDLHVGKGALPETQQLIQVDYTGWLDDGTKFDSSLDRNKPIHFLYGMGKVIPGWDQGLVGMNVGGKRQLVIPYDLAYGEDGRPPVIPPKATLTFEIELISAKTP